MRFTEQEYAKYFKQFKGDSKNSLELIKLSINLALCEKGDKELTNQLKLLKKNMFSIFSKTRLVPDALCSEVDMDFSYKLSNKADKSYKFYKEDNVEELNKNTKNIITSIKNYLQKREEAKKRDPHQYVDYLIDKIMDGKYY